jgi:hypothetical protein
MSFNVIVTTGFKKHAKSIGKKHLLSIYDKSDKENISDKELDDLLKIAGLL